MGIEKKCTEFLVGRPEERKQFGRPTRKWEDNIEMDVQEVRRGHVLDWSGSG
jgi:hypothetical protein